MPRPCKLTFDLLTLKVVSESRLTWATDVLILVFIGGYVGPKSRTERPSLGLSVLDFATDRRQTSSDVRRASSLNASALSGIININIKICLHAESPQQSLIVATPTRRHHAKNPTL